MKLEATIKRSISRGVKGCGTTPGWGEGFDLLELMYPSREAVGLYCINKQLNKEVLIRTIDIDKELGPDWSQFESD